VAEDAPRPEEIPDLQGRYMVGDYINLDLSIYHRMHVLEASVVFSHEDDETLEVVITGEPELEESDSFSMTSTLRVSRRVTLGLRPAPGRSPSPSMPKALKRWRRLLTVS
jgi:hypothetical protein